MRKILVGFSGGIDSSAVALELKNKNFDIIAITFILSDLHYKTAEHASRIAKQIGIEHIIVDKKEYFQKTVIDYFINAYRTGVTPNPCAMCNRLVKFPLYNYYAKQYNCDYFTTGHYVKIENSIIYKALDKEKDQSYFLGLVKQNDLIKFFNTQNSIKKKPEIVQFLKNHDIDAYKSKESQEICFIEDSYIDFLKNKGDFKDIKGDFINEEKKIIGTHSGYYKYTIGKRRGLQQGFNKRMYVKKIDPQNNTVLLSEKENMKFVGMKVLLMEEFQNQNIDISNITVKIRYRSKGEKIKKLIFENNTTIVYFEDYIDAISPGQIAVFYNGNNDSIVMSGIIQDYIEEVL